MKSGQIQRRQLSIQESRVTAEESTSGNGLGAHEQ